MSISGIIDNMLNNVGIDTKAEAITAEPMVNNIGYDLDDVQKELFFNLEKTKNNYFVQGQAGTGKSTFINYLKQNLTKRIVVVSPTAVAALNIGGVTIHSFFQIPPKDFIILSTLEIGYKTKKILSKTDLIIIDEISMVRPDMLDAIDYLAKEAKKSDKPFGGIQMLLVGDLCQLPPVIKNNVYQVFEKEYGHKNAYFFDAHSYKNTDFKKIEFSHVYRQSDMELLTNLQNIRENQNIYKTIEFFNAAQILDKEILKTSVTITPKRMVAENLNIRSLEALRTSSKSYQCQTEGKFEEKDAPAPALLTLKVGALVVFNQNDNTAKQWINGTTGIVEELKDNEIVIQLLNETKDIVKVGRSSWKRFEYNYDRTTDNLEEKEIGKFIQFPLQLGYALTIHKAQGKTLDKVIIDMDKTGAFAHGQMYVALSRTRKFSDIHVKYGIDETDIILDKRVIEFLSSDRAY